MFVFLSLLISPNMISCSIHFPANDMISLSLLLNNMLHYVDTPFSLPFIGWWAPRLVP
jgi:hypothetical protein